VATTPYTALVTMAVDTEDPDEAVALVRAELLSKLGVGEPVWRDEAGEARY
jgi:hypothetical protein